jgi:hypothetical protein
MNTEAESQDDEKIETNLLACHSYHVLVLYKPPVTFPHHNLHTESIYNSMQRTTNRFEIKV